MSKVALITGASRGIGREIAFQLAESGISVAVNYNSSDDKAKELLYQIKDINKNVQIYKADVSNEKEVLDMVHKIESELGKIDILVNNAGISQIGLFTDMTSSERDRMIGVNLIGAMNVTKAVLPSMIHYKTGNIINISSMWGEVGASCEVVYSATKAGLIGFTKALAKELGPSNIKVNCISPGVINTEMNSELSYEDMKELINDIPLNRIGTPSDIAKAVKFLISDKAAYITGQVLGVNGGMII